MFIKNDFKTLYALGWNNKNTIKNPIPADFMKILYNIELTIFDIFVSSSDRSKYSYCNSYHYAGILVITWIKG